MLKLKMRILSFTENTTEEAIKESLKVLKKSGIVAYPTESFYGLGVIANDEAAVKKLYRLKKRPLEKAMPLIVGNNDVLKTLVKSIPLQAEKLMQKFWPGPLTIIFDAVDILPPLVTGGKGKVAVRIPGDSFALYLARAANSPITATSANPSGKVPAKKTNEVVDYFGQDLDLIIGGKKTPGGKPSTLVDVTVTPPKVLREGKVLLDNLRDAEV